MAASKAPKSTTKAFSAEELEAMQAAKSEAKAQKKGAYDGEAELLGKIAEMTDADRAAAERIHAIVKRTAPSLTPKTWYGMPAYANAAGKVVCFFQAGAKFKTRYSTLGFQDAAQLDDGNMWPTAYAITTLTPADDARIAALITQALGK